MIPEEFPARTVPPSRNTGGSFRISSIVVSGRGCSSCSTVRVSPLRPGTETGTISRQNRLSWIAAPARRWLSSA